MTRDPRAPLLGVQGRPPRASSTRSTGIAARRCGEVTDAEDAAGRRATAAGWLEGMSATGQLPSQLLAHAQELNPELEIAIEYRPTAVIIVKTPRGEVVTNRGPSEDWVPPSAVRDSCRRS